MIRKTWQKAGKSFIIRVVPEAVRVHEFDTNSEIDDRRSWVNLFDGVVGSARRTGISLAKRRFSFTFIATEDRYGMVVKTFCPDPDGLPEFIWIDVFKDQTLYTQAFGQAFWNREKS